MMKIRIALAALAGAATLAAIGVTATATAASASTFPGPGPGPTGPTTVATYTPACTVSQLSATLTGGYGYQWSQYSQRELTLTLTNTSWRACTVSGYPGLQLLGVRYQSLPTTVVHVYSWSPSTAPITLYPGRSATDTISYTVAGPYYPAPVYTGRPYYAPSAYYLEVTLPSYYPTYPTYPTSYPTTYPTYGWQSHFTLRIPGAPVRIAQDRLSETALTSSYFTW